MTAFLISNAIFREIIHPTILLKFILTRIFPFLIDNSTNAAITLDFPYHVMAIWAPYKGVPYEKSTCNLSPVLEKKFQEGKRTSFRMSSKRVNSASWWANWHVVIPPISHLPLQTFFLQDILPYYLVADELYLLQTKIYPKQN